MIEIIWNTPDNSNGDGSIKQHAFKATGSGNVSLCGNIRLEVEHRGNQACIDDINPEEIDVKEACKRCVKIYNTLLK